MTSPTSRILAGIWALLSVGLTALNAEPATQLEADFARSQGVVRPLHGINKGPLVAGGLIDLTPSLRSLGVPQIRLHDCHWPNPDVVDLHAVFPDFRADPQQPSSYDFVATDEYLAATRQTGAQIIYRLGESIEHTARKRFVHPPADPEKWAEICLGIIRHCNEGWANGTRLGIRHWEIWNEPENRPVMWSGTDEDYFHLYRVASRRIKAVYPELKVGGPAVGASGQWGNGEFRPTAFVTNFLALCRRESLPLDFFSWHCYTADTTELVQRARAIRQLLDAYGFAKTESHLNEWNYLPGNTWNALTRNAPPLDRQAAYETMAGAEGAAFLVTALLELQDAPVDVCNLFHGEAGGFGLFNEHGVPQKIYYALLAFHGLLETPRRVATQGAVAGRLGLAAGLNADGSAASILVSTLGRTPSDFEIIPQQLPWAGTTRAETWLVDAQHDFRLVSTNTNAASGTPLRLNLKAPAVALLRLQPSKP